MSKISDAIKNRMDYVYRRIHGICNDCKGEGSYYLTKTENGLEGVAWFYCNTCNGTGRTYKDDDFDIDGGEEDA